MKKQAIALAVGALCVAPAAQAQIVFGNDAIGTVQFYGKLYPQFTTGTSSGATSPTDTVATLADTPAGTTAGSRRSVDSNNSYLGFRGERKLGSTGLKGIWQIEQAIEIDTGEDASFSNRNSFLGLSGGFGTVKLGHMDTIYKEFGAQYSPDETRDTSSDVNKELWSFGVKYEAGPIYVSLQHEIHKDFFGGTRGSALASGTSSKDRATRLSGTYKLGNHTLAADIAQINYTESGGILDSYKHIAWDVGIESKWGGPWRTGLEYVQAQPGSCKLTAGDCSTDGLKGQMFAAGVAYDLDKNTFLYLIGAKLINSKSAIFNNFAADVDVGTGADITQASIGMSYKF